MTVKELIEKLSKYPNDLNVYLSPDFWPNAALSVDKVEESYTIDMDEPPIIILTNNS